MTAPDNPYFARAMANWVWAQFFGKGLADPPDDLSRSNPPVHPELLDALARHFVDAQVRPPRPDPDDRDVGGVRPVVGAPCRATSTTPGSSRTRCPGRLTAHQMADALAQATDVVNRYPEPRRRHPGDRGQRPGDREHDPRHLRPLPAHQRLRLGRDARRSASASRCS